MNEQALFALAAHFTGPAVAHHGIGLAAGGWAAGQAMRFFEVREAIGVIGYMSIDEAKKAILATLESNSLLDSSSISS